MTCLSQTKMARARPSHPTARENKGYREIHLELPIEFFHIPPEGLSCFDASSVQAISTLVF